MSVQNEMIWASSSLSFCATLLLLSGSLFAREAAAPVHYSHSEFNGIPVPGVVIDHMPKERELHLASPALIVLPDGSYLASSAIAGRNRPREATRIFRSIDRGRSWELISTIRMGWTGLFLHRGDLYAMGTSDIYGDLVIRRSIDGGVTWTEPTGPESGLLRKREGDLGYHTASLPTVVAHGRIWRAYEDNGSGGPWAGHFRAGMASAPEDADLLNAENWTFSNLLESDATWLTTRGGEPGFLGWLEGNAVIGPAGQLLILLRVDVGKGEPEKAALVRVIDESTIAFDAETGIIDMPGASKMFVIRYHERSGKYWTLANMVDDQNYRRDRKPSRLRNTVALLSSPDLQRWEVESVLMRDRSNVDRVGFHYFNWRFDGSDIIAVARIAYPDGIGGPHNYHNANFFTFIRFPGVMAP